MFLLSWEVGRGGGGGGGGGGGWISTVFPLIFHEESRILNFCYRYVPNIGFSFFSIVNYQVKTATEASKHPRFEQGRGLVEANSQPEKRLHPSKLTINTHDSRQKWLNGVVFTLL